MHSQKQILDFIAENRTFLYSHFRVSKIGLFGSYARNEQSINSVIDLIVDIENGTNNLFDIKIELKKFFKDKFDTEIDICRENYIKPHFRKRINKEAIYFE